MAGQPLTSADLIPDETLERIAKGKITENEDLLNHRAVASRVAELAASQSGRLNIALFGPWGSGKSSFFGLLREELERVDDGVTPVVFDAWRNAGTAFHANFLNEIARQVSGANQDVAKKLFQTTRSVNLPFKRFFDGWSKRRTGVTVALTFLAVFVLPPVIFSLFMNASDPMVPFWLTLAISLKDWSGFAVGGTLLGIGVTTVLELSKVTVEESAPSYVTQFGRLFDDVVKPGTRCVVFIDELDRCSPADVMTTLEGLRTFLGHDRCIFVVAFDREAVSATIAGHLKNVVPQRDDSPYYETSGEYLDKIFQFQISLPPQRVHTFRRYALSLVQERGGLWSELRGHSPRTLGRVVSILSPIHITSPRRTKVLLNDFAVNVRILERLGFDWLARAEEIAAFTTIQTEFPQLAADAERHPALLHALADGTPPTSRSALEVYEEYRPSIVESLEVADDELDDDTEDEATPTGKDLDLIVRDRLHGESRRRAVSARLAANLDKYLRKLVEMRCAIPKADLLLMHSGGLVSFDDADVYNALILAGEAPRADTMAVLDLASDEDRRRAIVYLAEELEGEETIDVAQLWTSLAGEISQKMEIVDPETSAILLGLWERSLAEDDDIVPNISPRGYQGFARAMATLFDTEVVDLFLDNVEDYADEAFPQVVEELLRSTADQQFAEAASTLAARVVRDIRAAPGGLTRLIHRADELEVDVPPAIAAKLPGQLILKEPARVAPEAQTAAAIAAAETKNTAAKASYNQGVTDRETAMREVVAGWDDLRPESPFRVELLSALRQVGETNQWALDLHDELIDRDKEASLNELHNNELLQAIAALPQHAAARWRRRLTSGPAAPKHARAAFVAVVERALTTGDTQARTNAIANAEAIAPLLEEGEDLDELIERYIENCDEWDEFDSDRLRSLLDLGAVLQSLKSNEDELDQAAVNAYVGSLEHAVDADDVTPIVQRLRDESEPRLTAIADTDFGMDPADPADGDLHRLTVTLTAQSGSGGRDSSPRIPWATLIALTPTPTADLVATWVQTGPSADELSKTSPTFSLRSVPRAAWTSYSAATDAETRSRAWRVSRHANVDRDVLSRIVSRGVTDAFSAELASAIGSGSTISARAELARDFLTLPRSAASFARQAVDAAESLVAADHAGDAPTVAALLAAAAPQLTPRQVGGLRNRFENWIRGAKTVSRTELRTLESLGLLRPQKTLVQRIFSGD